MHSGTRCLPFCDWNLQGVWSCLLTLLQPASRWKKGEKSPLEGFIGQSRKWRSSALLIFHWPELSQRPAYNGREGWEMKSGWMPGKKSAQVVTPSAACPCDSHDLFFRHATILPLSGPLQVLFLCLFWAAPLDWLTKKSLSQQRFPWSLQEGSYWVPLTFAYIAAWSYFVCLLSVSCLNANSRKSKTSCFLPTATPSVSRTVPGSWYSVANYSVIGLGKQKDCASSTMQLRGRREPGGGGPAGMPRWHVQGTRSEPDIVLRTLWTGFHLILMISDYEIDTSISPIFQVWKLRHREVNQLAQSYTAGTWYRWDWNPGPSGSDRCPYALLFSLGDGRSPAHGRHGGNAERTGEMGELGDLAWLSETWVPILVRKRKKSFIINVAASMEGNPALAPPLTPPP